MAGRHPRLLRSAAARARGERPPRQRSEDLAARRVTTTRAGRGTAAGTRPCGVDGDGMAGQVTVGREEFGVAANSPVYLYWLRSPAGLAVAVSTWGASVVHVCAPDRDGVAQEVTLNHSDLEKIMMETSYYGATVGRVASTIAGARYKLGRKEFTLSANINGQHHAHGGFRGFDKQVWHAEVLPATPDSASVQFSYTSIDGEEGYAGTLTASVVYTVTSTNDLILEYKANTDKATPINLTNHTVRWPHAIICRPLSCSAQLLMRISGLALRSFDSVSVTMHRLSLRGDRAVLELERKLRARYP